MQATQTEHQEQQAPSFIQMRILGIEVVNSDSTFSDQHLLLMISNSAVYIIKDPSDLENADASALLSSQESLEGSGLVIKKMLFHKIRRLSFGNFNTFLKANKFPIKMHIKPNIYFFIELLKNDYLYLKKIFENNTNLQASQKGKKFRFYQKIRDELSNIDSAPYIGSLFKTVVINTKILDESQFQKIVFGKTDLNLSVEYRHHQKETGLQSLGRRVGERIKKGRFKVDYLVPDLWKDSSKLIVVTENDHDLLHNVAIPQFEKVIYFFEFTSSGILFTLGDRRREGENCFPKGRQGPTAGVYSTPERIVS